MKKKAIIVTVTSLLISKMGSSESRSELYVFHGRVHQSPGRVAALHEEPFE